MIFETVRTIHIQFCITKNIFCPFGLWCYLECEESVLNNFGSIQLHFMRKICVTIIIL